MSNLISSFSLVNNRLKKKTLFEKKKKKDYMQNRIGIYLYIKYNYKLLLE